MKGDSFCKRNQKSEDAERGEARPRIYCPLQSFLSMRNREIPERGIQSVADRASEKVHQRTDLPYKQKFTVFLVLFAYT